MSDLQEQFTKAAADVQDLPERPNNNTLLRLYALYKQATIGDADSAHKPSFGDFAGQAKYTAWKKIKGLQQADAMKQYIELVESLKDQF